MNNCITLEQEHIRAMDIFSEAIGNCATEAVIEQMAAEFEGRERKAVVRPWEELEDGTYAKTYRVRKAKLDADREKHPSEVLDYVCAPEVAKAELERYERMTRRDILQVQRIEPEPGVVIEKRPHVEAIHRYQRVLGLPLTDFSKPFPKVDTPDHEKQLERYLEQPLVDRRRIVEETTDRTFLGYIQSGEPELDLARRAQKRMFDLAGL